MHLVTRAEREGSGRMKNWMKALLLVPGLGALLAAGDPAEAQRYRGLELPPYEVVETDGEVEVRDYAPYIVAEVAVSGDRGPALRKGFRLLADYIFGGNEAGDKVAMTAPVAQTEAEKIAMTAPVTQRGDGEVWTVSFMMPNDYEMATLPQPKNDAVRLRYVPPSRRIALRFSGLATAGRWEAREAELRDWAEARGFVLLGPAEHFYYDDPFTLPFRRRNEVAFRTE